MTVRTEQREKRHEEILETALDQFIRRGYAGTKIKDIADAARMSVGLLFHYFDSKQALYLELIRRGVEAPRAMLKSLPAVEPLTFFELCAQGTLRYAAESSFTAKMFVLMGSAGQDESIPAQIRQLAKTLDFYRELVPLIEQGQRNGTIRPGDPLALSTTFWTALQGAIEAYARNPTLPLPEPEWIVDIVRAKQGG